MGRHRTPEEKAAFREKAVAMRRAGVGAKRIARELGVGGALVGELLRDEPPPASLMRMRAKDDVRDAAIALRREGRTYDEIRDELGVSKSSLSLWLRDLDFPTERQREVVRGGVEVEPEEPLLEGAELARELRREGWLLREIAAELGVSTKTAHLYCTGLPAPPRAVHGRSPEEMRALNRASWDARLAKSDEQRQVVVAAAAESVGALSPRELELLAVVAYWCEGSKRKPWRRSERVQFINSDPDVIRLWMAWLRTLGVQAGDCYLSVSIHESADVEAACRYWAEVLGVDVSSLAKPVLKRHNPKTVRKNTGDTYNGCLAIYVRKSRRLYQEIEGRWLGIARALDL